MFERLSQLPADPLLGLIQRFLEDNSPNKLDLGVGVYKNELGQTPVLASVKLSEKHLLETEETKSYIGPLGDPLFNHRIIELLFAERATEIKSRCAIMQTPGGSGALRIAGELIHRTRPEAELWVSDPSWANHIPLLSDAGVKIQTYRYYDTSSHQLKFDEMISDLESANTGDLVLVHACCHNPSGADLSRDQWLALSDTMSKKGLIPFIDMAYLGFAQGVTEDTYGVNLMVDQHPEVILAFSGSKSFGLYRERVGAVMVISERQKSARVLETHMASVARGIYSMPPSHGAAVIRTILGNDVLRAKWVDEIDTMRSRIQSVRMKLSENLGRERGNGRFDFLVKETGMFSFLGISRSEVKELQEKFSIYMADSSRICVAGLNNENIEYFCHSLVKVLDENRL